MLIKGLILLFLLFSIGALFTGLYHLITAPKSSVMTYKSLKFRVIFAALTLFLIAFYLFSYR